MALLSLRPIILSAMTLRVLEVPVINREALEPEGLMAVCRGGGRAWFEVGYLPMVLFNSLLPFTMDTCDSSFAPDQFVGSCLLSCGGMSEASAR